MSEIRNLINIVEDDSYNIRAEGTGEHDTLYFDYKGETLRVPGRDMHRLIQGEGLQDIRGVAGKSHGRMFVVYNDHGYVPLYYDQRKDRKVIDALRDYWENEVRG